MTPTRPAGIDKPGMSCSGCFFGCLGGLMTWALVVGVAWWALGLGVRVLGWLGR